jgi:DNA-directed RNA polymerase specialized sigma24 family protein
MRIGGPLPGRGDRSFARIAIPLLLDPPMAQDKELSDFLQGAQRRALRQAAYAVRRDEAAPDIVQDAMIKLAERYAGRPAAELPMLFQRILQNTILDFFRREKVRKRGWTRSSARNCSRPSTKNFRNCRRGSGRHSC